MRAAFGAEFSRHRVFDVTAAELPGASPGEAEASGRHENKHVRGPAGDVLAFAAVALRLQHRFALGHISHLAAVASAFQFHCISPISSFLILLRGMAFAEAAWA